MSSSISSSSIVPGRRNSATAWRSVLLGVLVGVLPLVGLEAAARLIGPEKFSLDLKHISELPRIAATDPKVLFVGSSVVRTDLDPDVLRYPRLMLDDARIGTWYFALKKYFITDERNPDILVIGFVGDHLSLDEINIPEVAQYFSTRGDMQYLFTHTLRSFGSRVEYLLNRYSLFYSLRERIGKRMLLALIPGYREAARALNQSRISPVFEEEARFEYLEALARLARDHGVRVIAMWLPTLNPQPARPLLQEKLMSLNIRLVDLAGSHVGDESCFRDSLHMNETCATLFSGEIKRALTAAGVPFD